MKKSKVQSPKSKGESPKMVMGTSAATVRSISLRVPDAVHARIEDLCNKAIHELVFACQHSDQDDVEDACHCLIQAQMNIEQANTLLVELEGK